MIQRKSGGANVGPEEAASKLRPSAHAASTCTRRIPRPVITAPRPYRNRNRARRYHRPPVSPPTAVIFDNDGLLLDTESVWTRAEADLYRARGIEFTPEHKLDLVGTSAATSGRVMAGHIGERGREADLIAELDALVFEELGNGVEPMTGALELVASLRERGTRSRWSPTRRPDSSPARSRWSASRRSSRWLSAATRSAPEAGA